MYPIVLRRAIFGKIDKFRFERHAKPEVHWSDDDKNSVRLTNFRVEPNTELNRHTQTKKGKDVSMFKYQAMKTYPVLNQAPRHEDV